MVNWLVHEIDLGQCTAEQCVFPLMVENEASLMVRVHMDGIIFPAEKDKREKCFVKLKEGSFKKTTCSLRCTQAGFSLVTGTQMYWR